MPRIAGAVRTVDVVVNEYSMKRKGTEEKPNGAFVALTDRGEFSTPTFVRAPGGVLPPVREGGSQDNCDGKGLDSLEKRFGG